MRAPCLHKLVTGRFETERFRLAERGNFPVLNISVKTGLVEAWAKPEADPGGKGTTIQPASVNSLASIPLPHRLLRVNQQVDRALRAR